MKKLMIVGTGITAIRVYDFIKQYNLYEIVGFVVDKEYKIVDTFCELKVYSFEELEKKYKKDEIELFIAIYWNNLNKDRKEMFYKVKERGYKLANLVSPNSIIRGRILGENCWIQDYVIFDTGATIKNGVSLAGHTNIGHHSEIGSFIHIAGKATLGGECIVNDQVFIGLNATVLDGVTIEEKSIIGAGTVIKRNVKKNTVCKLDKSNIIIKTYPENIIESKLVSNKNIR